MVTHPVVSYGMGPWHTRSSVVQTLSLPDCPHVPALSVFPFTLEDSAVEPYPGDPLLLLPHIQPLPSVQASKTGALLLCVVS